ncbi:MAG TPA: hypothetical protein VM891_09780 [Amaricoccus sp.]|jgi:hypothetical protein|nr:hypothetical protein [Amaricoccus sp.]HVL21200.1 hypothetical protein [Amaricoccus sp.]
MDKTEQLASAVEALSLQLRAHEAVLSALARRVGLTADDAVVSLAQRDMLDTPQHLAEVMERVRRILDRAGATR